MANLDLFKLGIDPVAFDVLSALEVLNESKARNFLLSVADIYGPVFDSASYPAIPTASTAIKLDVIRKLGKGITEIVHSRPALVPDERLLCSIFNDANTLQQLDLKMALARALIANDDETVVKILHPPAAADL